MAHEFLAFIDESGSEGDPDILGGFEFLVASAVVVRCNNIQFLAELWDRARRATKKDANWRWRSFKELNSDKHLFLISQLIGEIPFRFATVIAHKPTLHTLDNQDRHGDLYFFVSQLLLERISWICRAACQREQNGDGTPRIIFSERRQLRYERFMRTARALQENAARYQSNTDWRHIDLGNIHIRSHDTCDGLRVADFVASAFGRAVEYKQHGITDDRFVIPWSRQAFRSINGRCLTNGIKLYPLECEAELLNQDRFRWIKTHYTP